MSALMCATLAVAERGTWTRLAERRGPPWRARADPDCARARLNLLFPRPPPGTPTSPVLEKGTGRRGGHHRGEGRIPLLKSDTELARASAPMRRPASADFHSFLPCGEVIRSPASGSSSGSSTRPRPARRRGQCTRGAAQAPPGARAPGRRGHPRRHRLRAAPRDPRPRARRRGPGRAARWNRRDRRCRGVHTPQLPACISASRWPAGWRWRCWHSRCWQWRSDTCCRRCSNEIGPRAGPPASTMLQCRKRPRRMRGSRHPPPRP